jgi:hypothetical protein
VVLAHGDPGRREQHLSAARAAWLAIRRPDPIASLDREFPQELIHRDRAIADGLQSWP